MNSNRLNSLAALLLLTTCALAPAGRPIQADQKDPAGSADLTPVTINHIVQSVYAGSLMGTDGGTVKIKSRNFSFRKNKNDWSVSPGGALPAEGKTFAIGDRHVAIYPDVLGRPHCFGADGMKAEIAGLTLVFIDGNLDGDCFDEGEDFVILGEAGRFAFPYYRTMPLPGGDYTFEIQQGRSLKFTHKPVVLPDEAAILLNEFNLVRMNFGLFPTQCDPVYSLKCQAHADYMKKNNECTHDEAPGKPGYSKGGAEAGGDSVVAPEGATKDAVYSLWDTPLHGWDLRAPWFTQSAFGSAGGYAAIRTIGVKSRGMPMPGPVVFPPNDSRNVAISWRGEFPEPRTDKAKGNGYPITMYLRWGMLVSPAKMTAKLEQQDGDKWTEVKCQFTYNAATANKDTRDIFDKLIPVFVLPEDALLPNTVFRFTAGLPGAGKEMLQIVTCFTTGNSAGQEPWDTTQGG